MNICVNIISFQIYYNCIIKLLITRFGLPSVFNYVTDIVIYILTLMLIANLIKFRSLIDVVKKSKLFIGSAFIMFLLGTISALLNKSGFLLYIWGIRNMYRYYIFFIACIVFLKKKDVEKIFKNLFYILVINLLLVTYQYFVLGLSGDYLGGTFGIEKGANTYMNTFLMVVSIYYLSMFIKKQKSIVYVLISLVGSVYIATLSEVKMIFIEVIILLILAISMDRFTIKEMLKKLNVLLVIIILFRISIPILYKIYPMFDNFFNFSTILTPNPNGYSNSGDLDRLSALNTLYDKFFSDEILKFLFGFGIGSAEYSSFSFLTSDFYRNYTYLNYTWFSHAFVFIEYGAIGLIMYVFTFISIIFDTFKIKYKVGIDEGLILTCRMTSIICLLFIVYNSTLRTEGAYIIYFVLAIPYILLKEKKHIFSNNDAIL